MICIHPGNFRTSSPIYPPKKTSQGLFGDLYVCLQLVFDHVYYRAVHEVLLY